MEPLQADRKAKDLTRRLTERVVSAVSPKVILAKCDDELSDDNHHLHPPVSYPIPREEPNFCTILHQELASLQDNEHYKQRWEKTYREYHWKRRCWSLARKILDQFEQHEDLFLEHKGNMKVETPLQKPMRPQLVVSEGEPVPTIISLVGRIQFYLRELRSWEEAQSMEKIPDVGDDHKQAPETLELPRITRRKRKRASVVRPADFEPRRAPKRKAAEMKRSYYAPILSDTLDPQSASDEDHSQENEENSQASTHVVGYQREIGDENERQDTPQSQSPPDYHNMDTPRAAQLQDAPAEPFPDASPIGQDAEASNHEDQEVPSCLSVAHAQVLLDTMADLGKSVKSLNDRLTLHRLDDLQERIHDLQKEADRKKEDSDLHISHLEKYGHSTSKIEWERNKQLRDGERYLKDIEELKTKKERYESIMRQENGEN